MIRFFHRLFRFQRHTVKDRCVNDSITACFCDPAGVIRSDRVTGHILTAAFSGVLCGSTVAPHGFVCFGLVSAVPLDICQREGMAIVLDRLGDQSYIGIRQIGIGARR